MVAAGTQREYQPFEGILKGPKTLSIMPTYTCPAACTNCASLSSPHEKSNISLETILAAISEAKELGFYNVVFTGGEATLRWNDLLAAIRFAHELGFPTRIVTNAHWGHSVEIAGAKLEKLIEAGLDEINYSTGDEHTRFIPLERVANATVAALRRRFPLTVMVELRAERRVTRQHLENHPVLKQLTDEERAKLRIIESPWMPLEPTTIEKYPDGTTANRGNVLARNGCDNVLQTFTVQADGRVGSCCGIGMRLIPELNVATVANSGFLRRAIEEAEDDFLKLWIRVDGPEKILAWAAEKDPSIKWQGLYAHHCQACARVYRDPQVSRVIQEYHEEMIAHVMESIWIDERFAPGVVANALHQHRSVAGDGVAS